MRNGDADPERNCKFFCCCFVSLPFILVTIPRGEHNTSYRVTLGKHQDHTQGRERTVGNNIVISVGKIGGGQGSRFHAATLNIFSRL